MAYDRAHTRFAAQSIDAGGDITADPFCMLRLLIVLGTDQNANELLLTRAATWTQLYEGQAFLLDELARKPEVRPLLGRMEVLSSSCAASALIAEEDIPEAIAHAIMAVDASLVMLPRRYVRGGAMQLGVEHLAVSLVRRTARPCMVVDSPVSGGALLAATDLSDPLFPVIRYVRAISAQTEGPVTLLHNMGAPPLGQLLSGSVRPSALLAMTSSEYLAQQVHDRLKKVTASLNLKAETLVTSEAETKTAILAAAEECRADLIVTGTHRDCPSRLVPCCSMAEGIVKRAACSVLVVPLGVPVAEVLGALQKKGASASSGA